MYKFLGHCDLDLISRIILSGANPILFESRNLVYGCIFV